MSSNSYERLRGWRCVQRCRRASPNLLEQRRLDRARVEDRFEASSGELLNLLRGQLDPVPLRDPRANLAHDLLDVDVLAVLAAALLGGLRRAGLAAARCRGGPGRDALDESAAGDRAVDSDQPSSSLQYFWNSFPHSVRLNSRMRDCPMVGYHIKSWYTFDAIGAHTINGECSSSRSSGRRNPLRIIWSPQITSDFRVVNPKFSWRDIVADELDLTRVGDAEAALVRHAEKRDRHGIETHESRRDGVDRHRVGGRQQQILDPRNHRARSGAVAGDRAVHHREDGGMQLTLHVREDRRALRACTCARSAGPP